MVFRETSFSRVVPYLIEVVPLELFPTIPPIIQRLEVEVLGPKNNPYSFKTRFRSSRITPGCKLTVLASWSIFKIFVKCLDTSTTIPSPTHCPASEVPAVLGIKEVFCAFANFISFFKSFSLFG